MALQRPSHIDKTPLLLSFRLAQRHQKVLLPRFLLIGRALSFRFLLLLPLRSRTLMVFLSVGFSHRDLFFFGLLLA